MFCTNKKSKKDDLEQTIDRKESNHEHVNFNYDGIWINDKYVKSLIESKSARKSQEACVLSYIEINISDDSTCLWIWNFHEGTHDKYNKLTDNQITFENGSNIVFENDTSAVVTFGDETEKLTKVKSTTNERMPEEVIIETLFSDKYQKEDSINGTIAISFESNGALNGIDGFSNFSICFDYYDVGLDDDLISFYSSDVRQKDFIWDFNSDTLNIHEIDCLNYDSVSDYCEKITKGKIAYRLIKE
jgi:hypothetical protein